MRVAKAYRIAHSEFLRWLPDDQDKALAYELHLTAEAAAACPGCGTRPEDWRDPDSGRVLMDPVWEVHVAECEGCMRLAAAHREHDTGEDPVKAAGRKIGLRPADRVHPLAAVPGTGA